MDRETRLKRLSFRAWHRGTREADAMLGGYCDHYSKKWSEDEIAWFEKLLEENDVDVMAWAIGTQPVPEEFQGKQMTALQKLDFVDITK